MDKRAKLILSLAILIIAGSIANKKTRVFRGH